MPSFYRSFDALVLPSKGEGVGIPYLEAMFCKVPVIGTSVTGQADFLNDNTAFVVVCNDRVPVDCPDQLKYCQMTYLNHLWYLPSIPSLALRMRECKEDAHTRTIKVENAYDVMMQKYTLDKASKQMKSILDEIAEGRIK
jgi:glycosyltransferase involved in cell wall biosynthesis